LTAESPDLPHDVISRWRWAGLAAALAVYAIAVLTLGLGFLLAPASLALSVLAVRRLRPPRGVLVWVGVAANVLLLIPFVLWVLPALLLGTW
jgi:4-amino-4-deoxy-L-arabinose transferase-like glycosyltransferase